MIFLGLTSYRTWQKLIDFEHPTQKEGSGRDQFWTPSYRFTQMSDDCCNKIH